MLIFKINNGSKIAIDAGHVTTQTKQVHNRNKTIHYIIRKIDITYLSNKNSIPTCMSRDTNYINKELSVRSKLTYLGNLF